MSQDVRARNGRLKAAREGLQVHVGGLGGDALAANMNYIAGLRRGLGSADRFKALRGA